MSDQVQGVSYNPLSDALAAYNNPEVILKKEGGMEPTVSVGMIFTIGRSAFQITTIRTRGRVSAKYVGNVFIQEKKEAPPETKVPKIKKEGESHEPSKEKDHEAGEK